MLLALLLGLSGPAHAGEVPWWVQDAAREAAIEQALTELWPTSPVEVRVREPGEGDGVFWHDGQLVVRIDGPERRDAVPEDPSTQVVLARSWLTDLEVFDGGWLPPEATGRRAPLPGIRALARVELGGHGGAASDRGLAWTPEIGLATGVGWGRGRALVTLGTSGLDARSFSVTPELGLALDPVPAELALGARLAPGLDGGLIARPQLAARIWGPTVAGRRLGVAGRLDLPVGLGGAPDAAPRLAPAFGVHAALVWGASPAHPVPAPAAR